eukprot:9365037-Pyramimonas_sp.AAC.1
MLAPHDSRMFLMKFENGTSSNGLDEVRFVHVITVGITRSRQSGPTVVWCFHAYTKRSRQIDDAFAWEASYLEPCSLAG